MIFYKNREFDGMVILQNRDLTEEFLKKLEVVFGVASKVIFRQIEEFMSFNYGFKYVWLNAAMWGIIGSIFIFSLMFIKK